MLTLQEAQIRTRKRNAATGYYRKEAALKITARSDLEPSDAPEAAGPAIVGEAPPPAPPAPPPPMCDGTAGHGN